MPVPRSPTTIASTCLVVLLLYVVPMTVFEFQMILPTTTTTVMSNDDLIAVLPELSASSFLNDAVNSATGKLFLGEPIRTFTGQRRFQNYRSSQPHDPIHKIATNATILCDRWNVVTTIFAPSTAVLRAASVEGWCTVIVADTKTPESYMQNAGFLTSPPSSSSNPRVHFLSVADQRAWFLRTQQIAVGTFLKATPFQHFSRKNVGYLYAIQHGAKFLFDFDDDNLLPLSYSGVDGIEAVLPPLTNLTHVQGANIVQSSHIAFNHHPLMGASIQSSWPRGFPLPYIQQTSIQGTIVQSNVMLDMNSIAVLQYCANGNPDVDAIHRLVHPLPMMFVPKNALDITTTTSPNNAISTYGALMAPTNTFVPYNAQASVHTYQAMWALLLPLTVPGRVSDIWRAYFAQTIFRDLGLNIVILPPNVLQDRNEHNHLADMQAELDLYFKSEKLLEFLKKWKSPSSSVPERVESLWVALYERGYIDVQDVSMVQSWLEALQEIGYEFPPAMS